MVWRKMADQVAATATLSFGLTANEQVCLRTICFADKLQRSNTLNSFRDGKIRVLLVSEVAARGIDVVDCDLVSKATFRTTHSSGWSYNQQVRASKQPVSMVLMLESG